MSELLRLDWTNWHCSQSNPRCNWRNNSSFNS